MAVYTFDGPNLRIVLPSGETNIEAADIYSRWKEWAKTSDNSKYPLAFDTSGGQPLVTPLTAGAYFTLRNDVGWRIRPPEEDITVYITGNLVPTDATLPIGTPTLGNYTAFIIGIQPITQNVEGITDLVSGLKYENAIWIDSVFGTPGTTVGVNGTRSNPVTNAVDARVLADAIGHRKYNINGFVGLDADHTNWEFIGVSADAELSCGGYDMDNSRFENLILKGGCAGGLIEALNCQTDGFTNFHGTLRNCALRGRSSLAQDATTLLNCSSWEVGSGAPVLKVQSFTDLQIRNWSGSVEIESFNSDNTASVDLSQGRLIMGPTNIGGSLVVRGVGQVVDTSATVAINSDGLIKTDLEKVARQMTMGNLSIVLSGNGGGVLTVFDEDGSTPLATYQIADNQVDQTRLT